MGSPKQAQLVLEQFPKEPWARSLVEAFNQLSLETTQALTGTGANFKTLDIKTGATVADSFPINIKTDRIVNSVSLAMVLNGTLTGACTITAQALSGGKLLRVSNITGLAANTSYSLRLRLE